MKEKERMNQFYINAKSYVPQQQVNLNTEIESLKVEIHQKRTACKILEQKKRQ